jgi:methyl-accepting chemotaxis protein
MFASLKYKLIISFLSIGLALVLFMVIVVPNRTNATAEKVMLENVTFIVNLLADNLAVGMQTKDLDAGAALQQTLNLLKGEVVNSVVVLDPDHHVVKGMNANKAFFSRDTVSNKREMLTVFRTLKDSDGKTQGYVEINFSKKSFIRSVNRFKIFIWLAGIIAILSVIIVGIVLSNRIIMPLNRSVTMLKELASSSGDLTKRLTVTTKDEVGETARWFNIFVDKIQKIINQIAGNTAMLTSSSKALSETAVHLSNGTGEMTNNVNAVAGLTEKAVANVENISAAAEVMSRNITTVATAIEEMSASLNGVASNSQKEFLIATDANAQTKSAQELMDHLSVSAKQIGKVVDAIKDIADTTNLLSLNAAIEAASAGEAGKGFAVVAVEVKELSKQTAKATDDIRLQVEQIQKNTANAAAAIGKISTIIEEITKTSKLVAAAVAEQSATINDIAKSVGSSSMEATNIARNVSESAKGLSEISSNIQGVNNGTRRTAEGVNQLRASSEQLTNLASDLNSIVNLFKL